MSPKTAFILGWCLFVTLRTVQNPALAHADTHWDGIADPVPRADSGAWQRQDNGDENAFADETGAFGETGTDAGTNAAPHKCGPTADCNTNGIPDINDIAAGTSLDCDGDTIPDECEENRPHATNLRTGVRYCRIQQAIDEAMGGDTIVLSTGVFRGPGNRDLDFHGKDLIVRGSDPDDPATIVATVLDCEGAVANPHRGFVFRSGESAASVVAGITITGGYAPAEEVWPGRFDVAGGGVLCHDASPTIEKCRIINNRAGVDDELATYGARGGGICCVRSATRIIDSEISDNEAYGYEYYSGSALGGGVYCGDGVELRGCRIAGNAATNCDSGASGGGLYCAGAAIVTHCEITGNDTRECNFGTYGGGVYCIGDTQITYCSITDNYSSGSNCSVGGGGGVAFGSQSNGRLANCSVVGNFGGDNGGGVLCHASPVIEDCVIAENFSFSECFGPYGEGCGGIAGGGWYDDRCEPFIRRTLIARNSGYGGGGIARCAGLIQDCTIVENHGYYGGGISFCDGRIDACTITGNSGRGLASCRATVTRCNVSGSHESTYWDSAGVHSGSGTIANSVISGNGSGATDNGIEYYGGRITNCTIAANSTAGGDPSHFHGAGLYRCGGDLVNLILWGNGAGIGGELAASSIPTWSDIRYWTGGGTGNISLDPLFRSGPAGTWTANGLYNPDAYQSTLIDSNGLWTAGELVGLLLNPNTDQGRQFVIAANSKNTITVWGDTSSVAHAGLPYEVLDYRLRSDSPCLDGGANAETLLFADETTSDGTTNALYVASVFEYAVGDRIEYDTDGRLRVIVDLDYDFGGILIDPPLSTPSMAARPIVNYGNGDLRGLPRIAHCHVDIGAYELAVEPRDCNTNGLDDACEILAGTSPDCNQNDVPDECDLAAATSVDRNATGVPDECEPATLSCTAREPAALPGGAVTVDLFISGAIALNAYQVQIDPVRISGAGDLTPADCTVDDGRPDFIFAGMDAVSACSPTLRQVTAVAPGSATVTMPAEFAAYLGSVTFTVSPDATSESIFELHISSEPDTLLVDPLSTLMPFVIDAPCTVEIVVCDEPYVIAEGGRWLQVQPGPASSTTPHAMRVTSPDCPALELYADSNGCLVSTPQYYTASQWGVLNLTGDDIVPDFTYEVTALCGAAGLQTSAAGALTWRWGDVTHEGVVNVIDIQKVVQCAEGTLNPPTTVYNTDLVTNCTAPACDVFDVFAVLDAYQLLPYPGPVPCGSLRAVKRAARAVSISPSMASVDLVASMSRCAAGDTLAIDAYVRNIADLRGYQLELVVTDKDVASGSLICTGVTVDRSRSDYVFDGAGTDWPFVNLALHRLSSSLEKGGVTVGDTPRYLGTFLLEASADAEGLFAVSLAGGNSKSVLLDRAGQTHRFRNPVLTRMFTALPLEGDADCDGDVDAQDWMSLAACLSGPNRSPAPVPPNLASDCLDALDVDADGDVDLADFAVFQEAFGIAGQ